MNEPPAIISPSLADQLRQYIRESRLSFLALSRSTGVHYYRLSRFLKGKTDIRLETADKIARTLGLSLIRESFPRSHDIPDGNGSVHPEGGDETRPPHWWGIGCPVRAIPSKAGWLAFAGKPKGPFTPPKILVVQVLARAYPERIPLVALEAGSDKGGAGKGARKHLDNLRADPHIDAVLGPKRGPHGGYGLEWPAWSPLFL